jgi:hypothetical protein
MLEILVFSSKSKKLVAYLQAQAPMEKCDEITQIESVPNSTGH